MNDRAAYANANAALLPLADKSVHMIATSPAYFGLRSYDTGANKAAELGAEPLHDCLAWARNEPPCGACYVCNLRTWAAEMWRVLRDDGVMFLNLGDSYASSGTYDQSGSERMHSWDGDGRDRRANGRSAKSGKGRAPSAPGLKPKDLCGIPWRVALALQADGWYLRSDIIWAKPNPMPESVTDRPTKAHEYVFLLTKGQWSTRVVKFSDLRGERVHFFKNFGLEPSYSWPVIVCVRLATAILNIAQSQHDFSLLSFDPQIGEQCANDPCGVLVGDVPVVHRAAILSALFLNSDIAAEHFLGQLKRLLVTHANGDDFLIRGIDSEFGNAPGIDSDGNTSIAVNYSGKIGKIDFIHEQIITQSPKGCEYYWDAEAVKEAGAENVRPGGTASYTANGSANHGNGSTTFHQMAGAAGRNLRTVWNIATAPYSGAHYATWPPALVERMVKAGSSERGVCPECGKPWERVVERELTGVNEFRPDNGMPGRTGNGLTRRRAGDPVSTTTGWRPTCAHADASPIPAIVLDPFCGSGTTLLVARQLGRIGLGFDLSETYLRDNAAVRLGHDKLAAWGRGIVDTGDYTDLFRAHANGNGARSDEP